MIPLSWWDKTVKRFPESIYRSIKGNLDSRREGFYVFFLATLAGVEFSASFSYYMNIEFIASNYSDVEFMRICR